MLACLHTATLSADTREAVEVLYLRYQPLLRRRCQRLLGPGTHVDDAVQEIYWIICRHIEQYKGQPDDILPWLYRISTRWCLRMMDTDKRWKRNIQLAIEQGAREFAHILEEREIENQLVLQQLLDRFPSEQREAIMYRYVNGMTQAEIAEVMQVTRHQVRQWLETFPEKGRKMLS